MLRYLPLVGLIAFILEISSLVWMGGLIGLAPTLLLILGDVILGAELFRLAGANLAQIFALPFEDRRLGGVLASTAISRAIAGLLFIVPGFLSDLLAILVLLPMVRRWFSARMAVAAGENMTGGNSRTASQSCSIVIDAVAVEIIEDSPALPSPTIRKD